MQISKLDYRKLLSSTIIGLLIVSVFMALVPRAVQGQSDWLTGWWYRKSHLIGGSSAGAQSDYQVRIKVHYGAGTDSGEDVYLNSHCRTDFGDVRFTGADGTTLLDYWLEEISGTESMFWVKVPSVPASPDSATIYVYYGNPTATTTTSNGFNTFIRFDDGTNGNFDENTRGTASLSHVDGRYKITEDSVDDAFASGKILASWGRHIIIKKFGEATGGAMFDVADFGLYDEDVLSELCGPRVSVDEKLRFRIIRWINYSGSWISNKVLVAYYDTEGNMHRWQGSSWDTSGGHVDTSGDIEIHLWISDSTITCDVLDDGSSIWPNKPSIALSSVKSFSSGKCVVWNEIYTDVYTQYITQSIKDYFIAEYCDPEPTHGTWGSEEKSGPTCSNVDHSTSVPGASCIFSVHWFAPNGLDTCLFTTNNTGTWQENETIPVSGTASWANITKTLNSAYGVVIGYRWYCNDTQGNWGDTGIHYLKTASWLCGWGYRKSHLIGGSSAGAQSDYQVRINVHYGAGTDSGEDVYLNSHCRTDFGDVRFTGADGTTLLDYWMDWTEPKRYFAENGWLRPFTIVSYPAAMYYNNKTYVVWQGGNRFNYYITCFNHATGSWENVVKVADGTGGTNGFPSLMITDSGKIIVAYNHHEPFRIKISSNPEDINSWGPAKTVWNYSTYHRFIKDSSGNIYLFCMHGDARDTSKVCYKISSDEGETWGSTHVAIDYNGSLRVYSGNAEYDSANGRIHIGWCLMNEATGRRFNEYHAYLDASTGNMYSMDGTNLGTTISESEAETHCKVFDTGVNWADVPAVHLDSNGYPYLIDMYGNSSGYEYKFTRWTGSGWSTPQTITSTGQWQTGPDFIVHSPSNIEAYLVNPGLTGADGGDIEKWIWNGTDWRRSSVVLTETDSGKPLDNPCCVKNGVPSLKVVFAEYNSTWQGYLGDLKLYAYGDNGFVERGEREATFWVKVPSVPASPDSATVYLYYGNPSATTTSDGFNTFIRFDDGTNGNFDEDTRGNASLSHVNGTYKITEDSVDDAFATGMALGDWGIRAVVEGLSELSGSTEQGAAVTFGFFDEDAISDFCADVWTYEAKRRFQINRFVSGQENKIYVVYTNEGGARASWNGTAWSTSVTLHPTNGPLELRLWASSTTFYADVLSAGSSIFTNPASIPISSVESFSSGKLLTLSEPMTDRCYVTGTVDNYYVIKYCDPEPTHGTWGSEETPRTSIRVNPVTTDAILNSDYTIYISITNVTDLYAWEFQLDYNQTILDLTSTSIVSGGLNSPTYAYYNLTDEANGHLWWSVSTVYPTTTGITYDLHHIFEIHFHTIATGASNLDLYGTFLSDPDCNCIAHMVVDGSITVRERDLTVMNLSILDHGCSIYKNDTYADGTPYYYPVEVTICNDGDLDVGLFYVKLEVFWINGSLPEGSAEISVPGLTAGTSVIVNFTSLFHPMHTGHYRLTATVDSRNNVTESDETNNILVQSDIPVTVIGDVKGDGTVNILDAVIISLAWDATPSDPQWNICADINHDGHIDVLDGVRIGLHWGETW